MTTYTTFDPTNKNTHITLSGGNLVATSDTTATHHRAYTTSYKSTGKWYAEFTCNLVSSFSAVGIANGSSSTADGYLGSDTNSYGWNNGGAGYYNGVVQDSGGPVWTTGDVLSILFNADASTLTIWKNGGSAKTLTGIVAGSWAPAVSIYGNVAGAFTANFGASAWAYTPTAGFVGWDMPEPTVGDGAGTLLSLTGSGSRIAAGAGTMEQFTAAGGYNGLGAGTLEYLVVSGAGGTKTGVGVLEALTGAATGHQAARGDATLKTLTAAGTGYDSAIWTFAGSASVPSLSSSILTGEAITFAGIAPAPTIEIGTKDAVLVAPVPVLEATLLRGAVVTVASKVPAPVLESSLDNPAIITVEGLARIPVLSATLAAGQILTLAGSARAPILSAASLAGNVATVLIEAIAPILVASGYPAYTITFAGTAPVPFLASVLSGAIPSTWNTWVLNTRKGALTEYDNFEFNSFATFNGQILAAGSSGIVVLGTQDLDNATAITARVRSGKDSFASSYLKRVDRAYIGLRADGDMLFRVITAEGGARTYRLSWLHASDISQRRIPIGKGPKSRYFQFEWENEAGADFDIDNLLVRPILLRRRVQ